MEPDITRESESYRVGFIDKSLMSIYYQFEILKIKLFKGVLIMNVIVVKANNRPASEAVSSRMYETFINNLEGVNVTTYDVYAEDMPYFGQDLFNAFGKLESGEEMTDVEQRILAAKQKAMDALSAADVVVFAFPLWNLTIPAPLQTFIDYVYQAGFTFKYSPEGELISLATD